MRGIKKVLVFEKEAKGEQAMFLRAMGARGVVGVWSESPSCGGDGSGGSEESDRQARLIWAVD